MQSILQASYLTFPAHSMSPFPTQIFTAYVDENLKFSDSHQKLNLTLNHGFLYCIKYKQKLTFHPLYSHTAVKSSVACLAFLVLMISLAFFVLILLNRSMINKFNQN